MAQYTINISREELDEAMRVVEAEKASEVSDTTKRPSNIFRQAVAGPTDVITGIPQLAGIIGAGIEAVSERGKAGKGGSLPEEFIKALQSGKDKELLEFGARGREAVNRFLNIKEPVSLEDQASRIISSVAVPVPAAWLGKLGNVGGKAAALATPAVRIEGNLRKFGRGGLTKGDKIRLGTQAGLGIGIDQTVRALMDDPELPTIFSERALSGKIPTINISREELEEAEAQILTGSPEPETINIDSESLRQTQINQDIEIARAEEWRNAKIAVAMAAAGILGYAGARKFRAGTIKKAQPGTRNILGQQARTNKFMDFVDDVKDNSVAETNDKVSARTRAALETGASKFLDKFGIPNTLKQTTDPLLTPAASAARSVASKVKGRYIDEGKLVQEKFRNAVYGESEEIQGLQEADHLGRYEQFNIDFIDTFDDKLNRLGPQKRRMFTEYMNSRDEIANRINADASWLLRHAPGTELADDFPLASLRIAVDESNLDQMNVLMNEHRAAMMAIRRNLENYRPEEAPGMWRNAQAGADGKKSPIPRSELESTVKNIELNFPEVKLLANEYTAVFDNLLERAVKQKVFDEETATALKNLFVLDGQRVYVPKENAVVRASIFKKMGAYIGTGSTTGKNLAEFSNLLKRSRTHAKGVMTPGDPVGALRNYAYHFIEHIDKSTYQWNYLARMTGIAIDKQGRLYREGVPENVSAIDSPRFVARQRITIDKGSDDWTASTAIDDAGKKVDGGYIAKGDDWEVLAERFDLNNKFATIDTQRLFADDVIWVQHKGDKYAFYVPDTHLRTALHVKEDWGNIMVMANKHKRMFQRFTTGDLSLFSPVSAAFGVQQTAINRAMRLGTYNPGKMTMELLRTNRDAFVGAWDLFSATAGKDISNHLTFRLQTGTGLSGHVNPKFWTNLRDRLDRAYARSYSSHVKRHTGRLATSVQSQQFTNDLTGVFEANLPNFEQMWGTQAAGLIWRTWKNANTALHEGAAYGLVMRRLREYDEMPVGKELRNIVREAKDVAGDVTRMGTSPFIQGFNASIPFAGAMIQSWNSIGSHMMKHWDKILPMMVGVVGFPTMTELAYNSMLSEASDKLWPDPVERGKSWSYNDYYWNGFSDDQRTSNAIFFIPGRPPWEAVLIPISPEFGLFRSAVIEAADAFFNFSNVGESGRADVNGKNYRRALERVLDIPLPPFIKMVGALSGANIRAGLVEGIDQQGEEIVTTLKLQPFAAPERITGTGGIDKHVDSALKATTKAAISAMFGSAGLAYTRMHEAFVAGSDQSIMEGASQAFGTLGREVRRQARYLNPITTPFFGKALSANPGEEINEEIIKRRMNIQALSKDLRNITTQGMVTSAGYPLAGERIIIEDPIIQTLANHTSYLSPIMRQYDEQVSAHRVSIAKLGNATYDEVTKSHLTAQDRADLTDYYKSMITSVKAEQLHFLKNYEVFASKQLSTYFNRDVDVDLTKLQRRPMIGAGIFSPTR